MRAVARYAAALLAVALALPAVAGNLRRPDPRDDCAIGTVDRQRYRAIAAAVERLPPVPWLEVVADERLAPNPALTGYLALQLNGIADPDEQLATLHALLRREGAEFAWASISPMGQGADTIRSVAFHYNFNNFRTFVASLLPGSGRINISFHFRDSAYPHTSVIFAHSSIIIPNFKKLSFYVNPIDSCPMWPKENNM
jgi:hypothetical protein